MKETILMSMIFTMVTGRKQVDLAWQKSSLQGKTGSFTVFPVFFKLTLFAFSYVLD